MDFGEFKGSIEARVSSTEQRIRKIEATLDRILSLNVSVEKLATTMQGMLGELKEQGDRLEKLEAEPSERWSALEKAVLSGITGAVVGAVMAGFIK